jgi:N-acylneuraminate cytidylyltransferase
MEEDGALRPVFEHQLKVRSQDLPSLYAPTGATWWACAEVLRRERTFHVQGRTGHVVSWDHGLDIDTEEDWRLGEFLLQHNAEAKCHE